jgi:hypothetical protein
VQSSLTNRFHAMFGNYRKRAAWTAASVTASAGLAAFLIVPTSSPLSHVASSPTTASAVSRLRTIARTAASVNHDSHPATVTAARTVGRKALATIARGVATEPGVGKDPVYVITMTGHFVGYGLHYPPGAAPPRGTVMDILVNARTYWVLAIFLNDRRIQVGSLGKPFSVTWQ